MTPVGPVVVAAPPPAAGRLAGAPVLADTDPHAPAGDPLPPVVVGCTCGATLRLAADDDDAVDASSLPDAVLAALGARRRDVGPPQGAGGHGLRAWVRAHHGATVVAAVASGEHQPGRDVTLLQGVVEVAPA